MAARLTERERWLRSTAEDDVLRSVVETAELAGWRAFHDGDSRRSTGRGFPDLVLCRPPKMMALECKTEKGRVRPEQVEWLEDLRGCGVDARIVRPSDLAALQAELARR